MKIPGASCHFFETHSNVGCSLRTLAATLRVVAAVATAQFLLKRLSDFALIVIVASAGIFAFTYSSSGAPKPWYYMRGGGYGGGIDTDNDGVPDSQDRCPLVAGNAGCGGCPDSVCTTPMPTVFSQQFEFGCDGYGFPSVVNHYFTPSQAATSEVNWTATVWSRSAMAQLFTASGTLLIAGLNGNNLCSDTTYSGAMSAATFNDAQSTGGFRVWTQASFNCGWACPPYVRFSFAYNGIGLPPANSDGDGDGIPLSADRCPTVLGNCNGCPPEQGIDSDHDGTPDCFDNDDDNDGVDDYQDRCPLAAGAVDCFGCPSEMCAGTVPVEWSTGDYSRWQWGMPGETNPTVSATGRPAALSNVTITAQAQAGYGYLDYIDVILGGAGQPVNQGFDRLHGIKCSGDTSARVIGVGAYNSWRTQGPIDLGAVFQDNSWMCNQSFRLSFTYQGASSPVPGSDDDGDGFPIETDFCPLDAGPCNGCPLGACGDCPEVCDNDGDSIPNELDNCPLVFNPYQADCNTNGIGDACETFTDCNTNSIPDYCEADGDSDGTIDACDGCPNDPSKVAAGACGCGVADTDTDSDGTANCIDDDDDNDGVVDSADAFPLDASESVDTDGDGVGNNADQDDDGDGADDATDGCPLDANKIAAGTCGCGVADTDTDSDGTANCIDDDDDNDGVADSADAFPLDASESVDTDGDGIGNNGDQDDDGDGADDATDGCPLDANKITAGICGCGIADTDTDGDGVADCNDNCVAVANPTQDDCNGNGIGEACESFTDCNANGIPDSCDISGGFAQDCNTNGKPDSCDLAASGSPYPGAVQWTVASGGNGHWYLLVISGPITWADARSACEIYGGHLVTPTTPAEEAFAIQIGNRAEHPTAWVDDFGGNAGGPWLGGYQPINADNQQPWAWVTGETWSWAGWAPGEPNGGFGPGNSVTVQLGYANSNYYRGWADIGITDYPTYPLSPSYIIEWESSLPTEPDCNFNGIPDSCDIASGAAGDCNTNSIPDSCEVDSDADGTIDACDGCPNDPAKIAAGVCGCGVADTDTDSDGTANCIDDDDDGDGVADSSDAFPLDASESVDTDGDGVGNNADQDDDGDGADDASDGCPLDANKSAPGQCGCGIADTDSDGDGVADCVDNCVAVANPTQDDCNGNGIGEACESFTDCNANSIPDSCDLASGFAQDCNANGKPDSCDISAGNGSPYPGAVQWTVASGGNGHWYWRNPAVVEWSTASSAAIALGADLASITSQLENNFIKNMLPPSSAAYIGGIRENSGWRWVTGEQWSFTSWNPGEPNGGSGQILWIESTGGWNDHVTSNSIQPSIYEWPVGLPTESDCNSNGIPDSCDISSGFDADCDSNGIPNSCEIAAGALDCNGNGIPDTCDILSGGASVDCNANGIPDSCDIASGASMDCNSNAIPDSCDIAIGASNDVDSNGIPDECKPDCNNNDLPDAWEIAQGLVPDCNNNGIPDSCENDSRAANTGNMGRFGNGVPATGTLSAVVATTTAVTVRIEAVGDLGAATEYATLKLGQTVVGTLLFQTTGHDCPANPDVATLTLTKAQWNAIVASAGSSGNVTVTLTGSPLVDAAQCGEAGMSYVSVTYGGPAYDCDGNGLSDLCEVGSGTGDCNNNSILDACELLSGSAPDIDANGVIDSCQTDCNGNSLPDTYEVAQGLVPDCNGNGIPDSCDLAGGAPDCNANGIIDSCDIASGSAPDCNSNGKPDSCDISSGFAPDCNANSIPDSCEISSGTVPDCNNNGVPDSCDVASGAPDCNNNGVPDSCDVASGSSNDVDTNGVPDECKTDCNANGLPDAWEILQQLVPDCNGNSVPDSCDVADGTAKDCNDNGIPDSCDIAAGEVDKNSDGQPDDCQYRYGDFDLDGNIGGSDLAVLLALWGSIDPVVGDITGDGRVDGQDLAQILARWGPVP